MIDPIILAAIPDALKAEYAAGKIYRVGMLLFRNGKPGIISHLVETNVAASVTSKLLEANPYSFASKMAIETAGHVATNVKLNHLAAAVSTLKTLQMGNLLMSGAGLGFAVVSHQLLAMRMDKMVAQIQMLDEKLDRIAKQIDDLTSDKIERDFVSLRTACEKAEYGWSARKPEQEWLKAEETLHELQNLFSDRIDRILSKKGALDALEPFVDAFALAGATRISCRIAARDLDVARVIATEFAEDTLRLHGQVGAANIVQSQLDQRSISVGALNYASETEILLASAKDTASGYRDKEDIAVTRPLTILRLQQKGIDGREFLERVRNENEEPLLALSGKS